jgi:hypothetical protein
MSSFTAHLLFNRPTILPTGKERTHRMGGKWVDESSTTRSRLDCPVSASSVERVYIAVKSGLRTTNAIADGMLMSVTVVQRALIVLEDWPGGPRVRRIKSFPAHQFEVIE